MDKALRLLLIEDVDDDAQLVLRELRRGGYDVIWERIETPSALKSALARQTWDLILCDYSLPHLNAPTALEILKESGKDLPFIIISGTIGEETAVAALKAGAHDFLIKGKYARLIPAIERELRDAESRGARRRAEEELRENERLLSEAQRVGHVGSWSYHIPTNTMQYSDEAYRLFDVSPGDFKHDLESFLRLGYSSDRTTLSKWMEDFKSGRRPNELDFRFFRRNSELRYIQMRGAPVFDSQGKLERIVGTMQDVTERKIAEIQIRQQLAHLTALRSIDHAITSTFDMKFTLSTVLTQTLEQLQVDAADILLFDEETQSLKFFAGKGFRTRSLENMDVPLQNSHAGKAILKRRLVEIPNLKEQPLIRKMPEEFLCYFGAPLITKDKVNGVLEVFHRTPFQPYPDWLDFFEALAGQAAIAIDNATLFQNLQRSNAELEQAYDAAIEGWARALELRDRETEGHTRRVTEMTLKIARRMGVPEAQLVHMHRGGILHDIGKMGVPDSILLKPGPLTDEERNVMAQHPGLAYDWLSRIEYLQPALEIPYCHHEKWDGSGYPRGLSGEQIPLAARIFAVADVWDALTNDRPYRRAWSREEALEYIRTNRGTHFDPRVVDVFLEFMADESP
ncbi:MAG: hypothetical protein C3F07_04790 [Anaerolineales bacterium]|nr:MAG: hypothetical protein C3F07_04790 [Anaerolineales bacterium]